MMWNPDFTVAQAVEFLDRKVGNVYAKVYACMDRAKSDLARKRLAWLLRQYDGPKTREEFCDCCGSMTYDCSWSPGYLADFA